MRNLILLGVFVCAITGAYAQHDVTFRVNMKYHTGSFTTPEVNGDFNGWCGNCNAMTDDDKDGIWEVTLPLSNDSIEYKFAYDSWAGQESLTPGITCTKTTSGFTNRFLKITKDTVLPAVCWESCAECALPPDTSKVTFRLDMNKYTGSFTTPEVNGDFNGWCGNCNPMTDDDNDGVWETTLPLTQDSIEYKFAFDNWGGQETLTEGISCTKTTAGFTNRFIKLNGDVVLEAVCWESCSVCPPDSAKVTFRVDMSEFSGTFTTPEVNGLFNGWCGNCNPMTDDDNDNIWETTIMLAQGKTEYKFSYDNWAGQESLTDGDDCTVTLGEFVNRTDSFTKDTVLTAVCWESCDACEPVSTASLEANDAFSVYPNPAQNEVTIQIAEAQDRPMELVIFNSVGQTVYTSRMNNSNVETVNISGLDNGIYMIELQSTTHTFSKRIVVSR